MRPSNRSIQPKREVVLTWADPVTHGPDGQALLGQYAQAIGRRLKHIVFATIVCVGVTVFVCSRIQPTYESTAIIDVDYRVPAGVIGSDATRGGTEDGDTFIATQIRLIQSDSVLRRVAQRFALFDPRDPGSVDAPVVLPGLTVTRPPNTYLILITFRAGDRRLASDVTNAIAQSYVDFVYEIRHQSSAAMARFMSKELDEVKARMERSTAELLRFERELNVINPEQRTSMVSARLTQLNTEFANARTDRLKKEAAYASIQSGQIEAAEVSVQGEPLRRALENVRQAEQKFAEVQSRYGSKHPEYAKARFLMDAAAQALREEVENVRKRVAAEYQDAARREAILGDALTAEKAQFDRLNAGSVQYQALREAAEGDRKLYDELERRVKEATINSGFRNSAVKIADVARPASRPGSPNVRLAVFVALLLSLGGGIAVAIVLDSLDDRIHTLDDVNADFADEPGVAGTLPRFSRKARRKSLRLGRMLSASPPGIHTSARYQNAVRALRVTLQRGREREGERLPEATPPPRSLLVTGSTTEEGKTTVAFNLGIVNAAQGFRTLLIDASLHRPELHRLGGAPVAPGLVDVMTRNTPWRDAVTTSPGIPNLSLLPAGNFHAAAEDRLAHGMIAILLQAYEFYDAVIIDSESVNESADALQLAMFVHSVLIVACAGRTRKAELNASLDGLHRVRADLAGIVLNNVAAKTSRDRRVKAGAADQSAAHALVQRAAD